MSEQPSTGDRDSMQDRDNMGKQQDADRDRDQDRMGGNRNDSLNRQQVGEFDQFLDKHPEISEELRKDPSKVNDESWVREHKDLAKFLDKHPRVREELRENPSAVMNREKRYEKNENRPQ
jgi:hypothetical protein